MGAYRMRHASIAQLWYSIENADDGIRPRNGYYSNTSPLVFWGNTAEYRLTTNKSAFQNVGIKAGFFRLKIFASNRILISEIHLLFQLFKKTATILFQFLIPQIMIAVPAISFSPRWMYYLE